MIAPELRDTITGAVERKGVHCVDVVIRGDGGRPVIEVYVDTEQGITTEICADVSREVAAAIEASNLIGGPYRLDVSSPGIDRPLKFPWQYRKHAGRRIQVKIRAEGGEQSVEGTLTGVGEDAITVQRKSGEPIVVSFATILEARIPAPW
jgi:ribosome maturation factor RimP